MEKPKSKTIQKYLKPTGKCGVSNVCISFGLIICPPNQCLDIPVLRIFAFLLLLTQRILTSSENLVWRRLKWNSKSIFKDASASLEICINHIPKFYVEKFYLGGGYASFQVSLLKIILYLLYSAVVSRSETMEKNFSVPRPL